MAKPTVWHVCLEKNKISLHTCKFLFKSLMDARWVAKDTRVKRTAKIVIVGMYQLILSHLCSVGFAAFPLKWILVVLIREFLQGIRFQTLFIFTAELGSFHGQMSHY